MTSEDKLDVGAILDGKYLVIESLGQGAMGDVYAAEHLVLLERVALKVLHPQYARTEVIRERLRLEARILARVKSEYLVRVLDANLFGEGRAYIVMEYVEGRNLESYIDGRLPLPVSDALTILQQVCSGLRVCHEQGILHRDIKPENILVEHEPPSLKVRLIDFGIAKSLDANGRPVSMQTLQHAGLGSPGYMAPEQRLDASTVDARADVYSLGVVLYELLTARLPLEGYDQDQALVLSRGPAPVIERRPEVPRELSDIIARCLSPDPRDRFASATDLGAALDAVALFSKRPSSPSCLGSEAQEVRSADSSQIEPGPKPTREARQPLDSQSTEPTGVYIDSSKSRWGRALAVAVLVSGAVLGVFVAHRTGIGAGLIPDYQLPHDGKVWEAVAQQPDLHAPDGGEALSPSDRKWEVPVYSSVSTWKNSKPERVPEGPSREVGTGRLEVESPSIDSAAGSEAEPPTELPDPADDRDVEEEPSEAPRGEAVFDLSDIPVDPVQTLDP